MTIPSRVELRCDVMEPPAIGVELVNGRLRHSPQPLNRSGLIDEVRVTWRKRELPYKAFPAKAIEQPVEAGSERKIRITTARAGDRTRTGDVQLGKPSDAKAFVA